MNINKKQQNSASHHSLFIFSNAFLLMSGWKMCVFFCRKIIISYFLFLFLSIKYKTERKNKQHLV